MIVKMLGEEFEVADQPADYWGWVSEGRYDHEWQVYAERLKPEHTFVDLGAWVGAHSLYALRITTNVIAVEPDPVAWEILKENLTNTPAKLLKVAVSKKYGGTITLGSGVLGASTTRKNYRTNDGWASIDTFDAPTVDLRTLVATLLDPLFIKMDVEGSEEDIIADLDFFKERKPTLLIELHPFWWHNESEGNAKLNKLRGVYPTCKVIREGGSGPLLFLP
jgi:FkbM family methyltransferase